MTGLAHDLRYGIRMLAEEPRPQPGGGARSRPGHRPFDGHVQHRLRRSSCAACPFEESERLMHLENANPSQDAAAAWRSSSTTILELRERQKSFEASPATTTGTVNLSGDDDQPERFDGAFIYRQQLRPAARPSRILGRGFLPGEDSPGAEPVVVLGYGVWQTRYRRRSEGGRPARCGSTARRGRSSASCRRASPSPMTQRGLDAAAARPAERIAARPGGDPGGHRPAARRRLRRARRGPRCRGIAKALAGRAPEDQRGARAVVKPWIEEDIGDEIARAPLDHVRVLPFVLLIACTNVASLMMARASRRTREIAIRSSLGADRGAGSSSSSWPRASCSPSVGAVLGMLLATLGDPGLQRRHRGQQPAVLASSIAVDPPPCSSPSG